MANSASATAGTKRTAWTKEQTEQLRDLWLQGATDQELEEALGRSANAIAIKAHRMGLPPRAKATAVLSNGDEVQLLQGEEDYLEPVSRPKPVGKVRTCLMCSSEFWSSHAGERICPDCKSTDFWRSGNWMSDSGGWADSDW